MADTGDVECAKCHVAVTGPADPKADDVFACPVCGTSDTFENIMAEATEYVAEKAAAQLLRPFREMGGKAIAVTVTQQPQRVYRFIVSGKV